MWEENPRKIFPGKNKPTCGIRTRGGVEERYLNTRLVEKSLNVCHGVSVPTPSGILAREL